MFVWVVLWHFIMMILTPTESTGCGPYKWIATTRHVSQINTLNTSQSAGWGFQGVDISYKECWKPCIERLTHQFDSSNSSRELINRLHFFTIYLLAFEIKIPKFGSKMSILIHKSFVCKFVQTILSKGNLYLCVSIVISCSKLGYIFKRSIQKSNV